MEPEFKCGSCGHTTAFRKFENDPFSENAFELRNVMLNYHLVFKICAKCHIVHGFWHDLNTSKELSTKTKSDIVELQVEISQKEKLKKEKKEK